MKLNRTSSFVRVALSSLIVAALAGFQAAAADYNKDKEHKTGADLKHRDTSFVKDAAEGGMAEVQLGQLAAQKAENNQVKQLGQRIQADHTKANQELHQIAQKLGVTVPAELDRRHRKAIDDLQAKTGAEFDKAYAEHMIKDHRKDIKEFEKAARDAENSELKAFAEKTLPTLREHLRMAQDAGRAVGLTGSLVASTPEDQGAVGRSSAGTTGRGTSEKDATKRNEK